jgi:hypothetical protein
MWGPAGCNIREKECGARNPIARAVLPGPPLAMTPQELVLMPFAGLQFWFSGQIGGLGETALPAPIALFSPLNKSP